MVTVGKVDWSDDAVEDLHQIADRSVCAEIMDIAERELARSPDPSALEGFVNEFRHIRWRRAVRRADVLEFLRFDLNPEDDEFHNQACDYVIVYRSSTDDEAIKFHRLMRSRLIILRVLHNREFPSRYERLDRREANVQTLSLSG
jgi:plasmid stabilization system protein ParE